MPNHNTSPTTKIIKLKTPIALNVLLDGQNPILSDYRCFESMAWAVIDIGTIMPNKSGIHIGKTASAFISYSFKELSIPIRTVHNVIEIKPITWKYLRFCL